MSTEVEPVLGWNPEDLVHGSSGDQNENLIRNLNSVTPGASGGLGVVVTLNTGLSIPLFITVKGPEQ